MQTRRRQGPGTGAAEGAPGRRPKWHGMGCGHGVGPRKHEDDEIGSGRLLPGPAHQRGEHNTSLAARAGEKGAPEKEPKVEAEVEMAGRRREQLWPLPSPPSPCKRIGACLIGWPVGSAALRELSNVAQ